MPWSVSGVTTAGTATVSSCTGRSAGEASSVVRGLWPIRRPPLIDEVHRPGVVEPRAAHVIENVTDAFVGTCHGQMRNEVAAGAFKQARVRGLSRNGNALSALVSPDSCSNAEEAPRAPVVRIGPT